MNEMEGQSLFVVNERLNYGVVKSRLGYDWCQQSVRIHPIKIEIAGRASTYLRLKLVGRKTR